MEKMNKFMSDARLKEIYEIIERQKREDLQAAKQQFSKAIPPTRLNTKIPQVSAVPPISAPKVPLA